MNTLTKLATITLSLAFATGASAVPYATLLVDDFEGYTPGQVQPGFPSGIYPAGSIAGDGAPIAGDDASIVGSMDGVLVRSGNQMLQFVNTHYTSPLNTGSNSDLYYLIDLSFYAATLANQTLDPDGYGTAFVDLSAWFNTGISGSSTEYFIGLSSYDQNFVPNDIRLFPSPNRLGPPGVNLGNGSLPFVADPSTWEMNSINNYFLHKDTRFLEVRIGAHKNSDLSLPLPSSYVDDVKVDIFLPEGFTANAVSVPASGSTIVFFGIALAGICLVGRRKVAKA